MTLLQVEVLRQLEARIARLEREHRLIVAGCPIAAKVIVQSGQERH